MAIKNPPLTEVVEAIEEFLDQEIRPGVAQASLQFKLRIAVNLLKIAGRELRLGRDLESEQTKGLLQILSCEEGTLEELNAEVCKRIQGGDFDEDYGVLLEHLENTTLSKLAIDNPGYSTYVSLRPAG